MVETDIAVRTVGLTKTFRDFWMREKVTAVRDLDLAIQTREVYGLLGPNGSGKSTTIKMILGLMFPSKGQVSVFGRGPRDVAGKARIGFLPEESYLYPFLDAYETLDYYGRLFHQPRAQRRGRIDMLLEMVGLTSVAYRRVGEYSKGMQRRIGLAQALINDPDLLILDEPTSGMDPIGTRQFKDIIRTLASRGKTVVLSSHILADVEDVCDRVCILYGGRKRALGSVNELLADPGTMQLTTDELDEQTLDKVRAVLVDAGKSVRGVSMSRARLEDLFLRIVREAQDQRLSTGGSVAGGQVAEFLRAGPQDPTREVIDELVRAAQPEPPPISAPAPQAPQSARAVIDELVAPTEPPPQASAPKTIEAPQADQAVLDSLLGRDEEPE
jgi:ABC-2 type transport system ATP-binding protein